MACQLRCNAAIWTSRMLRKHFQLGTVDPEEAGLIGVFRDQIIFYGELSEDGSRHPILTEAENVMDVDLVESETFKEQKMNEAKVRKMFTRPERVTQLKPPQIFSDIPHTTVTDRQAKIDTVQAIAKNGASVFLSGTAGVGKSYTVKTHLIPYLTGTYQCLAPTNPAAMPLGGMTFHLFFGLGVHPEDNEDPSICDYEINPKFRNRQNHVDCYIVDECSLIGEKIWSIIHGFRCMFPDIQWVFLFDYAQCKPICFFEL